MSAEDQFQVIVEVIEVQGLIWPSPTAGEGAAAVGEAKELPNPFVEVLVGKDSRATDVHVATATCNYNWKFIFSCVSLDQEIDIRVCHKSSLSFELIGSYVTSVKEVHQMPNQAMSQTMCPLIVREVPSEPRGFVRLAITVSKVDEAADVSEEKKGVAAAVGDPCRVLQNPELGVDSYDLHVDIHRGTDLLKSCLLPGSSPPSCQVRVEFSGSELKTKCQALHQLARNPIWNETLRFPASLPCSSDRIAVELWNDGAKISTAYLSFQQILKANIRPTWLNFYTETQAKRQPNRAGRQSFVDEVVEAGIQAITAVNFFFDFDDADAEAETLPEFCYLGRILVSASCMKLEKPPAAQKLACKQVEIPPTQECTLWGSIFHLSGLNTLKGVRVEVAFGDWVVSAKPKDFTKDAVSFDKEEGELREYRTILPAQIELCYDLIIRVYRSSGKYDHERFMAYGKLSAADLMKTTGAIPKWITLQWTSLKAHPPNPTRLLAGFSLQKSAVVDMKIIERPPRPTFNFECYKFEVKFFQAVDLPVHNTNMPSPCARASLGGKGGMTRAILDSTHPDWNEVLKFDCTLLNEAKVAGDLRISVLSGEKTIGEISLPVEHVLTPDAQKPQWYPLTSERFPNCRSKILCCFRLTKSESPEEATEFPAPEFGLNYAPYDVQLFVVGVRLFSNDPVNRQPFVVAPRLQLEFGRAHSNPNIRSWVDSCKTAVKGADGSFNYLTPFGLQCHLPTNEVVQSYLDVKIFNSNSSPASAIGTAYVHLTSLQPGITKQIKDALRREFCVFDPSLDEALSPPLGSASAKRPDFLQSLDRFGTPLETEAEPREELRKAPESALNLPDLPHLAVPIVGPSRDANSGKPEILGLLKIRCTIKAAGGEKN